MTLNDKRKVLALEAEYEALVKKHIGGLNKPLGYYEKLYNIQLQIKLLKGVGYKAL